MPRNVTASTTQPVRCARVSLRAPGAFALVGALSGLAGPCLAAEPWIARPLTLPSLALSGDVAVGVGQTTLVDPFPRYDTPVGTRKLGSGLDIEAALGLPARLEVAVKLGIRFAASGALTTADAYGRLFDAVSLHLDPGTNAFANPELRVREGFVDTPVAAVGFEVRLLPALAARSANVLAPGIPLRFRVPGLMRIDTGLVMPVSFANGNTWGVELPLALWFQHEALFFGPMSGVFLNNPGAGFEYGGVPTQVDIQAGVGMGFTIGICDLKAQVLTLRANDPHAASFIGGGAGLGIVVP